MPTYTPLQKDEIRVLDVLPAEDLSAPIQCRFRHVFLADDPQPRFAALSYTWGDPNPLSPPSEILIDGAAHDLLPNLASALRHLRCKNETVSLWADAVCINQTDTAEKTTQLLLMGDIYRKAERVLIWLGAEAEDSNLAMETIQRWASWKVEEDLDASRYLVGSDLDDIFSEAAFGAINRLLARPYWSRVWIQQEVALGRHVSVHCGQRMIPFNVLERATTTWKKIRDIAFSSPGWMRTWPRLATPLAAGALTNLVSLRQQQQAITATGEPSNTSNVSLFEFLRLFGRLDCTDPRDRIYALLGLVSPLSKYKSRLNPSYDKPTDQVFSDITRFMIEDEHTLRPIVIARTLASKAPVTFLPSWVPDWTAFESGFCMHLRCLDNFGTETRLNIPTNAQFSADGKVLSLTNTLCDAVSVLQPTWGSQYMKGPRQDLGDTLRDRFLPNGVSYLKAVFHVLVPRHEFCQEVSSMSEALAYAYMVQALQFLRSLSLDTVPLEELSSRLTELAHTMFGRTDNVFSRIRDRNFRYETATDNTERGQFGMRFAELFRVYSAFVLQGRVLFETENGTVGVGPEETLVGDVVFQTPGFCGSFILRRVEDHYVLVGEGEIFPSGADLKDAENGNGLQTVDIW